MSRRGIAAVAVGVVIGLAAGVGLSAIVGNVDIDLSVGEQAATGDAAGVIENHYWKSVDPTPLQDASINGMVDYLHRLFDDRFTHYFNPKAFALFQDSTAGRFSGIGLAVTEVKRGLRVAQVYADSPAKEQRIKVGDYIVAVEGESIAGEPSEQSTAQIRGPAGSEVTITVLTPGKGRRELTVERSQVDVPAVAGKILHRDGKAIGYVRMATFSRNVHQDLRDEVEKLYDHGAEGIVLDLRGNGGGLLQEAVLSASVFVPEGKTVVSTEGRTTGSRTYEAVEGALPPKPTAVLIDGNTASASEILSSALADYHLATLVGTRSFGKGTFQEVIGLDNGGGLDLTVGQYLTADGTSLAGHGIRPQVRVAKVADQLDRALDVVAGELR